MADNACCYIWSLYTNSIVRGVIGADVLPESVLVMVMKHKMISVTLDPKGWNVVDEEETNAP